MNKEEIKTQLVIANDGLGKVIFSIDTLQDSEDNRFFRRLVKPINSAKLNVEYILGILDEVE